MTDRRNGTLIEVTDLKINFRTRRSTVKALDGVDLGIRSGETFGLVGESGCGKSVTASSMMGLVPQPPGEVEDGMVLFRPPPELVGKIRELGKLRCERALMVDGSPDAMAKDVEIATIRGRIRSEGRQYDILSLDGPGIRNLRGKDISMIFQEPGSALNPVIPVGDQISEVFMVHKRRELAESVLQRLEMGYEQMGQVKGGRNGFDPFVRIGRMRVARRISIYRKLVRSPNSLTLRVRDRTPFLRGYLGPLQREAKDRTIELLRKIRISDPEKVIGEYPFELSGGMQQRVMIAMAMACRPQLLIADEPTTSLDVSIQAQVLKLLKDLQQDTGMSILLITHNLGVVAETCDRVGVMYAGSMVEVGDCVSMFGSPLHPYTKGLIGSIPRIDRDVERLETIEGSVPDLSTPPPGCRFHPRCPSVMGICKIEKPLMNEIGPGHQVACHLFREVVT